MSAMGRKRTLSLMSRMGGKPTFGRRKVTVRTSGWRDMQVARC
jgi:hypothetical protein